MPALQRFWPGEEGEAVKKAKLKKPLYEIWVSNKGCVVRDEWVDEPLERLPKIIRTYMKNLGVSRVDVHIIRET